MTIKNFINYLKMFDQDKEVYFTIYSCGAESKLEMTTEDIKLDEEGNVYIDAAMN